MNDYLLITFGCSWTAGVGVGYVNGMDLAEYKKIAWQPDICDNQSYRGLLCAQLGMQNLNFAHGASSNQAQFYYAKRYFGSDNFSRDKAIYKKIIVLHAITSTARNFFFDATTQELRHVKYDQKDETAKFMLRHHYDHDFEIQQLQVEMNFWNAFYKSMGISNLWVDTFNHHAYDIPIDNLVDLLPQRDLMSQMCVGRQIPLINYVTHHKSSWKIDDYRVAKLIDCGLLNPISMHPTVQGHLEIAQLLEPIIRTKV